MKKIVFLGAKEIGGFCLKKLYENKEKLGIEIIGVASSLNANNSAFVLDFAKEKGLKILNSDSMNLDSIESKQPKNTSDAPFIPPCDIIFSVQFHKILNKLEINQAKEIAINLHLAPLPEYRGCNQFSFAILNNERKFGVSLHKLECGIDSGDLLFERRFLVPKNCFVDDLIAMANSHAQILWEQNLENLINGNYTLKNQKKIKAKRIEFHLRNEILELKNINLQNLILKAADEILQKNYNHKKPKTPHQTRERERERERERDSINLYSKIQCQKFQSKIQGNFWHKKSQSVLGA